MKKSALYTRTGDQGTTSLVGGQRISKSSSRLEAYGTVDELNSHLGLLRAQLEDAEQNVLLERVQCRLFDIGSHLACDPQGEITLPCGIDADEIAVIEKAIDQIDNQVPPMKSFILPAGCLSACQAHVARTVARRAERRIIALGETVDPLAIAYINRLSDYLFALARLCNHLEGIADTPWTK